MNPGAYSAGERPPGITSTYRWSVVVGTAFMAACVGLLVVLHRPNMFTSDPAELAPGAAAIGLDEYSVEFLIFWGVGVLAGATSLWLCRRRARGARAASAHADD